MEMPATKTCRKCGEVKPLDEFNKRAASKDGLQSRCRECAREATRAWTQANRERKRETNRAWREANREHVLENKRAWYQANHERARELARAWRKANPERVLENKRAWYQANHERARENLRAWREANPERVRENERAWRKANPEKARLKNHKRRDREACAVPQRWIVNHSLGDPLACWWCGRGLLGAKPEIEHVMPIELKGPTVPSNLVKSCQSCNRRKTEKHPLVWIAELVDG